MAGTNCGETIEGVMIIGYLPNSATDARMPSPIPGD